MQQVSASLLNQRQIGASQILSAAPMVRPVHWDEIEELLQHLQERYKNQGQDLVIEGKMISNTTVRCTLSTADTAARGINSSVLIHCHAWLRVMGFKSKVQQHLLSLPFYGWHLFGPQVDQMLEKM